MIHDFASDDRSPLARAYAVCVIGAGPAGITIARSLAAAGADVALMEAGGLEISEESQDIYRGEIAGLDYVPLETARLRYFGGTSNHWAGWCRNLDPIDFVPKGWNPLSGWPVDRLDLDPWRAEADAILDVPSETEAPDLPIRQAAYRFRHFQFRWSPPTRFAEKYGPEIQASPRISLWLNANLVDLRLDAPLGAVTEAIFRSYDPADPGLAVRARLFCLCTGGIENARLLLNFRSQIPEGIGNGHGLVGAAFADHPHFVLADTLLRVAILDISFYSPTDTFMREVECLNFGLRFQAGYLPPELWGSLAREVPPGIFALQLSERLRAGTPPEASLHAAPPLVAPGMPGTIRIAQEAAVNLDSRVRLAEERDPFGLQRAVLDWRLNDLDVHTMRTAVTSFARHMAEQNLGRARIRDWLLTDPVRFPDSSQDEVGGKHHMCSTRMADDPRHGVVDRDCRVHGLDNLYIGGSSVFATTGHANPTYTLTQLALRLGAHLTERLSG